MKLKYLILFILPLVFSVGACKDDCKPEKQVGIDEATIIKFLTDKNISAQRHSSGVYYQIIATGSGNISYTANTTISAKYTGRLLNGGVFDASTSNPIQFKLGQVITGWQVAIPLIQKGGKIRIFIPSGQAYGCDGQGAIPPNSVLDFDIELADVTN